MVCQKCGLLNWPPEDILCHESGTQLNVRQTAKKKIRQGIEPKRPESKQAENENSFGQTSHSYKPPYRGSQPTQYECKEVAEAYALPGHYDLSRASTETFSSSSAYNKTFLSDNRNLGHDAAQRTDNTTHARGDSSAHIGLSTLSSTSTFTDGNVLDCGRRMQTGNHILRNNQVSQNQGQPSSPFIPQQVPRCVYISRWFALAALRPTARYEL